MTESFNWDFKSCIIPLLIFGFLTNNGVTSAQIKTDSLSYLTNFSHAYPNWSPDGTQIAFQSDMFDENSEIYTMNIDGTGLKRLTFNSFEDESPIWTKDGNKIIFASYNDTLKHDIFIMDADGKNKINLTNSPGSRDNHHKLSPDGESIIFNSDRDSDPSLPDGEYDYELYEMNLDGTDLKRLTFHPEWDTYPEISPDGSMIVWRRVLNDGGNRNSEIFTADRDGSNPVNLTNYAGFDGYPTWSPNGTKILFVSTRHGPGSSPRPRIYVMNRDGTGMTQLTFINPDEADVRPWWSPDGKKFIFNRLGNGSSEFVIGYLSKTKVHHSFNPVKTGDPVKDDGSSRGVTWGDYDWDGFPDLLVSNTMDNLNHLYHNQGNNEFNQITEDPLTSTGNWSEGIQWIDIDNDGDLDLFVSNQWKSKNELYINENEQGFKLSGNAEELSSEDFNSPGSCWADFNLDGYIDVYIVNRDQGNDGLFKNNGDGTFSKVESGNISYNGGDGRSCAWGDTDGDRFPELYVGNFIVRKNEQVTKARNFFYKNNSDGSFTEITDGPHVTDRNVTYGVSMIDYDYDGDLDIFVTNIASTDRNRLYENNGNGEFIISDIAPTRVTGRPSKGHTWGDFNHDGYLDLFIANGTTDIESEKLRNNLFINDTEGDFIEVTDGNIVTSEGTSAGTAWADYDLDGDLDIYIANWKNNNEENEFYRNDITDSKGSNWIALHLRGNQSNRFGIGAKIRLKVTINGNPLWQTRWLLPATGYASQNEPIVHFGMSNASRAEVIEINWPSGIVDRYEKVPVNEYYTIIEDNRITPSINPD